MPGSDDVMVYRLDTTLGLTMELDAQTQLKSTSGQDWLFANWLQALHSRCLPQLQAEVRTGRGLMRGNGEPQALMANMMAQCSFQPQTIEV